MVSPTSPPAVTNWSWLPEIPLAAASLSSHPEARLLQMVQAYGYEHQSFLSLAEGGEVWFSDAVDAAVVYHRHHRVAIVTAAPLAPRENWLPATQAFIAFCRTQKMACLMLPVSQEYARVAEACGMGLLRAGESGYFHLPTWKPAGDRAKKVRAGVNQARKAGVHVTPFDPQTQMNSATRDAIEQLCQDWLSTHEVAGLGWLFTLDPFTWSEQKRYFLAHDAKGELVGMLVCSPFAARRGWYLEDLLRQPAAPRGVSELLVVEALQFFARAGANLATLGTSPLAGIKPEADFKLLARLLRLLYRHGEAFYHFQSLHRFKAKFVPSFVDPEYVAIWPPRAEWRMINALLHLVHPAGLPGLLRSKWEKYRQVRIASKHRHKTTQPLPAPRPYTQETSEAGKL